MSNIYSQNIKPDFIGIDGCRGGWLFSIRDHKNAISIQLFSKISDAGELLETAQRVLIDMPVGLVENKMDSRDIDDKIRGELGKSYKSSVFAIPCKQAVYANNYKEACAINREVMGKGISIQAWNICAKIKELDIFLAQNTNVKRKLQETHPELTYQRIKGSFLINKKKTKEGFEERLKILENVYPDIQQVYIKFRSVFFKKDVADDDMLDSLVLALWPRYFSNTRL